jgi:predicted GIY-YIG superfamily endonuclease
MPKKQAGGSRGWVCYTIVAGRRTYVGVTNNLRRRLRQHNGLIKGGAKATRGAPGQWRICWYVRGFQDYRTALQFEWRMHNPPTRRSGVHGRARCLGDVCRLPRWTSQAPRASDVPLHVRVASGAADAIRAVRFPVHVDWSAIS